MVEEWSRVTTISRVDSRAHGRLLPSGSLFDQRKYPKSYPIPFSLSLFWHRFMCDDCDEAKKPECVVLNTIIALYRLFVE